MLDVVVTAFSQVFIHSSTADEATALVEHDKHATEVLEIIDDIRDSIRAAQSAGKILHGPLRPRKPEDHHDDQAFDSSTLNLMANLAQADVAVIDDRALNEKPFVVDEHGHRARAVTSLDMIEGFCQLAGRSPTM